MFLPVPTCQIQNRRTPDDCHLYGSIRNFYDAILMYASAKKRGRLHSWLVLSGPNRERKVRWSDVRVGLRFLQAPQILPVHPSQCAVYVDHSRAPIQTTRYKMSVNIRGLRRGHRELRGLRGSRECFQRSLNTSDY